MTIAMWILRGVLAAVCVTHAVFQTLYYIHMLQLNSYRPERYQKWMREHDDRTLPRTRFLTAVPLILMMMFGFSDGKIGVAVYAAAIVLCAISAVCDRPKKAKKPLVYTSRVKRLLTTLGVIGAVLLALSFVLPPLTNMAREALVEDTTKLGILTIDRTLPAALLILVLLPVMFVTWANSINGPMERHINNNFVKDAKRILSDMKGLTVIGITGSYGKTSAKNYLTADELDSLQRIVSAYLDLAEDRAKRRIPMTMEDWAKRLDIFLMADDREILTDAGSITAEIAKAHAESEFEKYRVIQDRLYESDYDRFLALEQAVDNNK